MRRPSKSALIAVTLLGHCLVLAGLVASYESVMRLGEEVRFRCSAYDPYDPLRGRYLQASVVETCTNVPPSAEGETPLRGVRESGLVAKVERADGSNGLFRVVQVADRPLDDGLWVSPKSVSFNTRGGVQYGPDAPLEASVSFPDRLFLNEKLASTADGLLRKKSDRAVAVYRAWRGRIVLVDIEIDGESVVSATRREVSERR